MTPIDYEMEAAEFLNRMGETREGDLDFDNDLAALLRSIAYRARAEQRERDAEIAERYPHNSGSLRNVLVSLAHSIAAAIRNQKIEG